VVGRERHGAGRLRLDGSRWGRDIFLDAVGSFEQRGSMMPRSSEGDGTPNLDHFRELLNTHMERRGLRSTDQRKLIVETFFNAPNHISIEELLAEVRQQDPKVGYATVYRTLKLLTECGVAFERKFGDGLTRYELADESSHHDHLICTSCAKIIEFEEPKIEEMQEKIAARYGFELLSHKHEMYGTCAECQAKGRSARRTGN
jgi:Fur family ferric uptake transcriptional regulator